MEEIIGVFGINWKLLLIQSVNFGLLLLILWRFLYRPLARIVDERQKIIETGVRDAETAAKTLSSVKDKSDTIIIKATSKGEVIVAKATAEAKVRESKLLAEANTRSESVIEEAKQKAQEIKRKALSDSESEIARLAILSAEKVLIKREEGEIVKV